MKIATYCRRLFCLAAFSLLLCGPSAPAQDGSLTPPPGPPEPVMKTLQQVEPRNDVAKLPGDATAVKIISAPGSYYLTADLAGASGKDTIRIDVSSGAVTLDLNGFSLSATATGRAAVAVPAVNQAITIRNGGIFANASVITLAVAGGGSHVRCEDLAIVGAGAAVLTLGDDATIQRCRLTNGGIIAANRARVRDCTITAPGINDVSVQINGSQAEVIGVTLEAARGHIKVGQSCLVADCRVKVASVDTAQGNLAAIQTDTGCVIRHCTVDAGTTTAMGILSGTRSTVHGCTVTAAGPNGVFVFSDSIVSDCAVSGYTGSGITALAGGNIQDCAVNGTGGGVRGIETVERALIRGCTVTGNLLHGISVGRESTVENCVSTANSGNGVLTSESCTVKGCVARSNLMFGLDVGIRSLVTGCTANDNTSNETTSGGIRVGSSSQVVDCIANNNKTTAITPSASTGVGILVTSNCQVMNCTTTLNDGDGIQATGNCRIVDNLSTSNGPGTKIGAGVHTTSTANHIEGNTVVGNDIGIDVDSTQSLIIGNSARSNGTTNYTIATNNRYGEIVLISSGVAVSGNSAASVLTTTDPHANFSY